MSWSPDSTDLLCVNTIRSLAVDMIETAKSGHPGLPLGAAPMAHALWSRRLVFDPQAPDWADRDRFILSAGHGSTLQYALLHLAGFDLPLEELRRFRQWGSRAPGHPERGVTPGVEATTGPLGQGSAIAVGFALAERLLAARFNKPGHAIFDHFTYALVSDGDLMEGISAEAASLAGRLGLGKLVYLYDSNGISLDGPLSETFTEDVAARYRAYGWQVLEVVEGDEDLAGIEAALEAAAADLARPTLIIVRTTIGYGAPTKQGTNHAHGAPLGGEEARRAKEAFGFDPDKTFVVPDAARARYAEAAARGRARRAAWLERLAAYEAAYPALAAELKATLAGEPAAGWDADLPSFADGSKALATRESSGVALAALAARRPDVVGLDADLSSSTKTRIGGGDVDGATGAGRNVRCGVREHAMAAIANGLAAHGGLRPYTATFLAFSDYMRPSIRLAALDRLETIFVFTHDSLAVGEDGPTHQPVEQAAALRAIPRLAVLRPGDANEAAEGWRWALGKRGAPTAIVLSRQKLPTLPGSAAKAREGIARGGYTLVEAEGGAPKLLLLATGSEVALAVAARDEMQKRGVPTRVVSLPCLENFAAADPAWREATLPAAVKARVAIEAGLPLGWRELVGDAGEIVGVSDFGASAPGEEVLARYGFTTENVVAAAERTLSRA